MSPFRSQRWLNIGVGVFLCFVVVNGGVAFHNLQRLRINADKVAQSRAVLEQLESLVSTVADAETGQRGFLITGEESYLEPYQKAVGRADEEFALLVSATKENSDLRDAVAHLKPLVDEKFEELAVTIALARDGDLPTARQIVLSDEGKQTMERIRSKVESLRQSEMVLLASREAADDRAYHTAVTGTVLSALAAIAALIGLLLLFRNNVAALKESAFELFGQQELLRATLVSIGDGVIVTDVNGSVTLLNTVAENLTGWKQTDAQGKDLDAVFCIVNETSRQPVDNPSLRALREGKIVGLANHTILIAKDGREWPIDDSAAPIRTRQGKISGAVLVFREISERKQHEAKLLEHTETLRTTNSRMAELVAELKASEELFHSMADSIPQLAWMTRPDGHIYWYNKRWYEYTGTTPEKMEGWGWQSVHDPQELSRVLESWRAALAAGEPWEDTFPLRRYDGAMRWHLSRAEPLRDVQGNIVRWFGTNTDITERLEMEQALREADRRKDEFLATLAHELRNPIAPISNALQVWPLVENDREEVEKLRGIMDRQIRQMTRLVDDLLDVSRITRGKIQLRRQSVELGTIVAGAVEAVRPFVESLGHTLTIEEPQAALVVDGDVARLTQIVGNLLQNAAKYTDHGGQIVVKLYADGDDAVVQVTDNGVGIPPEMLDRIFDIFQQVDQALDRSYGGLGLGLTLVRRLVDLHGGEVRAFSEGAGLGSEFTVRLPLVTATEGTISVSSPSIDRALLPRHQVLVVDDVQASAKTLALMLKSIHQEVAIRNDGMQALEYVHEHRPEIVFLDIAMPGMDGYEVVRRLRHDKSLADVFLVALTGYGHEEDRRRAIEAGFDFHLTKPASIDQLVQLIQGLPSSRRQSSTQI